jgi:hypothetical protein
MSPRAYFGSGTSISIFISGSTKPQTIAVAAGRVLIAERAATIAAADKHGLFIFGQPWAAEPDA